MKQTKKNSSWKKNIGMVLSLVIGVAAGIVMAKYIDGIGADTPIDERVLFYVGLLIGIYVAMLLHVIVHEAGHLVFGLLTGYKFSSFRIFSLMWLKEDGKFKLKRIKIAGTGGQCLMDPPDMKDGKIPVVLYNFGGSFANVIVSAVFGVLYLICADVLVLSEFLLILTFVGFMMALTNGIPMRFGMIDNDGYNAFSLSKNKEANEAFWVQLKVAELNSKGVRLRDMPAQWFTVPTDEAMKNSMVASRGVFACNRLMDEGKFEEANELRAHLLEIDSGITGLHRNLLICDRMYSELIGENRHQVIQSMLTKEQKKFMKAMKRFPSVLRTEYVLALIFENDALKAEKIKKEFEKALKSYPYSHEIEIEKEMMRIAENKRFII